MFKYMFEATFTDGHKITQHPEDRYSKHEEGADHNFSSFTDVLDYLKHTPLQFFALLGQNGEIYAVSLETGEFFVNGTTIYLDQPLEELENRKLIYFRTNRMNMQTHDHYVHAFNLGYEGKHPVSGKIVKKVITIHG